MTDTSRAEQDRIPENIDYKKFLIADRRAKLLEMEEAKARERKEMFETGRIERQKNIEERKEAARKEREWVN